jgi:putative transcriptional regulator
MMSEVYESLMEGLNEAIAFAGGKDTSARIHKIEVQVIDVAEIRAQTGLSQSAFAKSIGVAKVTRSIGSMAVGIPLAPRMCCSR